MTKLLLILALSLGLVGCATQQMKDAINNYDEVIGNGEIIDVSPSLGAQKTLVRYQKQMYTCYVPNVISGGGWCIQTTGKK